MNAHFFLTKYFFRPPKLVAKSPPMNTISVALNIINYTCISSSPTRLTCHGIERTHKFFRFHKQRVNITQLISAALKLRRTFTNLFPTAEDRDDAVVYSLYHRHHAMGLHQRVAPLISILLDDQCLCVVF